MTGTHSSTVGSMLRLHRTLALCFWCSLLTALHTPALADEEASLGIPQSTRKPGVDPPAKKGGSILSRWTPDLKIPSFPSLQSFNPWGRSSEKKDVGPSGTSSPTRLTEEIKPTEMVDNSLEEHSGFEEEKSTSSPQESFTSSVEIGTIVILKGASPPTGATYTSSAQSTDHSPVPASHSDSTTSTKDDLSSHTPSSTNTPTLISTHSNLPLDTAQTQGYSSSTTAQHFLEEHEAKDPGSQQDQLATLVPSTIAPATTVPTALVSTQPKTTTVNLEHVETTLARHPLRTVSPFTTPQSTVPTKSVEPTVSISFDANEAATTDHRPWQTLPDLGLSEAKAGPVDEQHRISTTMGIKDGLVEQSTSSTTQPPGVNSPTPGEIPAEEDEEEKATSVVDLVESFGDVKRSGEVPTTTSQTLVTGVPSATEDWLSDPTDSDVTYLPDCNQERSGICNSSDTWVFKTVTEVTPAANTTSRNISNNPFLVPAPPMFVPLHSDWNSAMAAWGLAWEVHVYGLGAVFAMVTLASALNLLCLPLRCPSGCGYFALVSLFLLAAGCTRAFSLLYDAYGHQDRLPSTEASLLLYEAPFPCLTAAFGLVFLLLSMRSRMQLSYSAFQRPCFLACLVLLHFAAAFGPLALLKLYQRRAPFCLFLLLISRGAFVALASFLSTTYFVFYCYVRADSKHIYHLNNTSPTPAERYNRCPFAESRDWNRAAATVCLSALFSLACAGLQLYAMLHALDLAGGAEVSHPWPWWAFQFSCRVCEAGVCLTLALVVAQPVYCSDHLPQAASCWTELLAAKSPIIPGSYQWTLSQQEKLAICDPIGHGETECLPLYTLVDERLGSSLNGLDLLYHSNRGLAYRDLDLDLDLPGSGKPEEGGGGATSGGSSFTSDSTDLRPPSPINLRRSIDEALFSEALFPMSLFSPSKPFRCSDLSLNAVPNGGQALPEILSADPGLYRTSSCVEMIPQARPPAPRPGESVLGAPPSPSLSSSSSCSSPERWRGSSSSCSLYRPSLGDSSLVLCSSPDGRGLPPSSGGSSGRIAASGNQGSQLQRCYNTLGAASQESLDLDVSSEADRSVQEEFISACRQIDALSVCSETIDL